MKKSFDWAKAAFAALVFLALPFMLVGFLANFVWFGITIGLKLFAELSEWALGDDPEIAKLAEQALAELDELEQLELDAALERFKPHFKNIPNEDIPEWMRD